MNADRAHPAPLSKRAALLSGLALALLTAPLALGQPAPAVADLSLGRIQSTTAPQPDAIAAGLAHYATAASLEKDRRPEAALRHYLEALKAFPGEVDLAMHTAELVQTYQGRAAAVALLEGCIKANPADPRGWLHLARFLTTYPDADPFQDQAAPKLLAEALTKFPTHAALYREAVILQLTRNQRDEAAKLMTTASKQPSTDPAYWLDLGRLAQEVWPLSHPEKKALHRTLVNPFFEKALTCASAQRGDVRLAVAQYYLLSNQLPRAQEVTEEAVRRDASQDARRLLVRLYQSQQKSADAITLLETIVKIEPNDVESRRLLAALYEATTQYDKAVPHLEQLIQVAGGGVDEYLALGFLLLRSNQFEKAWKLSQRTMALFPSDPRFTFQSAIAQSGLHRAEDSLRMFEKTETLAKAGKPELLSASFYQYWADTLHSLEKYDEAAERYQRAIDLTTENNPRAAAEILNNLGYMWLKQGKHLDKAEQVITKATELEPENRAYQDSLGWLYYTKGDYPAALKVFQQIESLIAKEPDSGDAEILDHLAQTYQKLGDNAKALATFDRALKLTPDDKGIKARREAVAK